LTVSDVMPFAGALDALWLLLLPPHPARSAARHVDAVMSFLAGGKDRLLSGV